VYIDFNSGLGRRAANPEHSPELSSAGVAEHGPGTTGEDGRHPSSGLAQCWVAHRKNPSMNAVEPLRIDPASEALPADSQSLELLQRDHAVLARGNPSNYGVPLGVGEFLTHVRE
jgi:hypothetical protein